MAPAPLPPNQRRVLAALYCAALTNQATTPAALAERTGGEVADVQAVVALQNAGLVRSVGEELKLTDPGRGQLVVVMAGGVFNIIHPGHLYTLSEAKRLGDVLVVSVATDRTVRQTRGTEAVLPQEQRVALVNAIKHVDVALLGSERDIFDTVERVRPDIIALGYDQQHGDQAILDGCLKRGLHPRVVRLGSPMPAIKSTQLLQRRDVTETF
jgi:cytidyltransferase-like protein